MLTIQYCGVAMSAQKVQTKIVWSVEESGLISNFDKSSIKGSYDAVRLVYTKGSKSNLIKLLKNLSNMPKFQELNIPLMIDVSQYERSVISKINRSPDFVYGEEILISLVPAPGDLVVKCLSDKEVFSKKRKIYIGYGSCILSVIEKQNSYVKAKVAQGGRISVGMDVRSEPLKEPSSFNLAEVDMESFKSFKIDAVILPGIIRYQELRLVRQKLLALLGVVPWIFIRVDHFQAIDLIKNIWGLINGVLISRGELAMSVEPASIPMATKEMIQECHKQAKVVMISSDLLSSMKYQSTPTRAEVSDVANAVIDGTDAVVLADDLTKGKYAQEALTTCKKIITNIESGNLAECNWLPPKKNVESELEAISFYAYKTAKRVQAKAIVCITKQGNTAQRLASYQVPFPVIAVTFSKSTQRRMSLVRGVQALYLPVSPEIDEVLPLVKKRLIEFSWLNKGDLIVFTTVTLSSVGLDASNLFTVQELS